MPSTTTPSVSLDQQLERLLASDPAAIADPFTVWNRVREQGRTRRLGGLLLVTHYDDVKAIVRDERGLSNGAARAGTRMRELTARLTPAQLDAYREVSGFESLYVSRSDGAQHDRLRGIAHRVFTPRRIADMHASVERTLDEMLDGIDPDAETDVVAQFAYRLPLTLIADMLSVPPEQREQIHVWSNQLGRNRNGDNPEALMVADGAMREFRHYVEEILVPLRMRGGGTDLVSALLEAEGGERLAPQELTAMFVVLLFAGHETTTNLIGNGLLELLRNRDQWERLCADPSLAPRATEELLRYVSPVQWLGRVALQDFEIAGEQVSEGQTIFPVLAAANRDPAAFNDPERLDITRPDARNHLALGFGPHFCLGNALARLEGAIVFRALAERYPDAELVDEHPGWRGNAMLRGLQSLPLRFGARRMPS
ncbi:MAG TPA: cytochrome P450 [Conexibacter sp.]|jgi:cytochrome P450